MYLLFFIYTKLQYIIDCAITSLSKPIQGREFTISRSSKACFFVHMQV